MFPLKSWLRPQNSSTVNNYQMFKYRYEPEIETVIVGGDKK